MKILITGNAGSGKTTLSEELARLFAFEHVIHLDKIVWGRNWSPVPKEVKEQHFREIAKQESWLVDGVSQTLLRAADVVIFLDFPRRVCFYRAIKRTLRYAFRSRPELPGQPSDIYVFRQLLKIIWQFPKTVAPGIRAALTRSPEKMVYCIRSNKAVKALPETLSRGIHEYRNNEWTKPPF